MKKKVLLFLAALLSIGSAWAENVVTIPDAEIKSGAEGELLLTIENNDGTDYRDFEFDITLPEGISFKTGTNGYPVCYLGDVYETDETGQKSHSIGTNFTTSNQQMKVVISSTSGTTVTKSGYILRIPVIASDLSVGTELTTGIWSIILTIEGGTRETINGTYKITIVENRVTLDETVGITDNTPTGEQNVLVKRSISANKWNTICLPFAMTAEQIASAFGEGTKVADFQGYDVTFASDNVTITDIDVKFNDVTVMEANHPYIINTTNTITYDEGFSVDGVNISLSSDLTVNHDVSTQTTIPGYGTITITKNKRFIGTYNPETTIGDENLFISGNLFYYANSSTKPMKAFRGYFSFTDKLTDKSNSASSAKMVFFVEEATGISNINSKVKIDVESVYNINGQYVGKNVDLNTLPKGVYIINGKKKIVK